MGVKLWITLISAIAATVAVVVLLSGTLFEEEQAFPANTLRIGVLPDENRKILKQRYQPLFQHLEKSTGMKTELVIPENYDQLLDMLGNKEIEIAYLGGFTFVKAHKHFGAVPLVMRDIDTRFRSYFLARVDGAMKTIGEFKGTRLAFGSKLSTSGHLMPRYFLKDKGFNPETYFSSVEFSGAHDKTALWVRDGRVDIGAANAVIIDSMFSDGRLSVADIRIIWKTPSYPGYVWVACDKVPARIRQLVISSFLDLGTGEQAHARVLNSIGAGGFLPARLSDFKELREVAESLGML